MEAAKTESQMALQQYFRPEFLKRLDEIVIFKSLSIEDMAKVAKAQSDKLVTTLSTKHINLIASDEAVEWLAKESFKPQLGTRPLRHLIQNNIINRLSKLILEIKLSPGETVRLKVINNHTTASVSEK